MMWLTWRQFRTQAVVAAAVLVLVAIALASTGPHLAHLYNSSGLLTCHAHGDCPTLANNFLNSAKADTFLFRLWDGGIFLMFLVPALLGVFWGAPLITREIETGTYRLAWNQSVTRTRWLAVKLGLLGVAAMVTTGLLSLMLTWWGSPVQRIAALVPSEQTVSRLLPALFATRGIAPVGYAAFAFALGVTLGVVIRRTVPAMAVTLAIFAFVQVAVPLWIRPHLISPLRSSTVLLASNIQGLSISHDGKVVSLFTGAAKPGAWVLSDVTTTASGHPFTGPAPATCTQPNNGFQACVNALGRLNLRQVLTYQPASRYWALQWYETGIFLVLALLLAGLCFWWTRRRLS
jgi:hypothetical protein